MIESITISNVATFGTTPEKINSLSQFNFIFGSNGVGKTTISRVIADETKFPTCSIKWAKAGAFQPLVYNHDFVERNFNQSAELKGVFTLGEKQVDTLTKIATAKRELDALAHKLETLTLSLQGADGSGGKKGGLAALEAGLKDKCWAQKQKHDAKLQGAFEGYRNSSEKFKGKVLQELTANKAPLLALAELEKKAESVFGSAPTQETPVASVAVAKLLAHETNPILRKRIIGKEDVDIAAMIKRLGNSDWVRQGRVFYEANDGSCPFCQQSTSETFAQSLSEYFDEAFVTDSKAVDDLATDYATEAARIQQQLTSIIASPSPFLDLGRLQAERELLDARIALNNQRLAEKKKEASRVVELESVRNVCVAIKSLIDAANTQVSAHNTMVANIASERKTLTAQVWRFVLEEMKAELTAFHTAKDGLARAISAIEGQVASASKEKAEKTTEIRELEKQMTSVQPTIDGINGLLSSFGFQGFKLARAASGNSYKLVRSDGSRRPPAFSSG